MLGYREEVTGVFAVQLYDERACRSIVGELKWSGAWTEARVSARVPGGFNPATRADARSASVLALRAESEIRREFDAKMEGVIKPLVRDVWRICLKQHSETHFVRYAEGNFYRPHSDTGINRTDRHFTVLCYLNDDFEGGETNFPELNYKVRPRRGKAIVFPAGYLHGAEPVLSGEKYVLVSWLIGP
ncbi:MAG: 2OG-Fe(II) oxygenase [Acidobacteriota bacterium]|nr:2OG-Fe(II) oxygenase [Acidobacteriota bacterium]